MTLLIIMGQSIAEVLRFPVPAEAWQRVVLENAMDAFVGTDCEHRIREWNRKAQEVFGWSKEEALGKSLLELVFSPEQRRSYLAEIERVSSLKTQSLSRQASHFWIRASRRDGSVFPLEAVIIPISTPTTPLFFSFLRDLSEEERAERERAARAAEERATRELRAQDEFIALAGHELKNPLTALRLQLQLYSRRYWANSPPYLDQFQVGKLLRDATRVVDRMYRLVEDLLDLSRIAHGRFTLQREETDLAQVVRDVVERMSSLIQKAGSKTTVATQEGIVGKWDRYRIEQIFSNLLSNAIKYGAGKQIEITAGKRDGRAVLRVRDYGPGIAKEHQQRIFDRFEKVVSGELEPGVGLGLYISRKLAQVHGGDVRVESEPGKGATFTLELPLSPGRLWPCT